MSDDLDRSIDSLQESLDALGTTAIRIADELTQARAEKRLLIAERKQLVTALAAATHALRSYQLGNSSPDFAKSAADWIEDVLHGLPAVQP